MYDTSRIKHKTQNMKFKPMAIAIIMTSSAVSSYAITLQEAAEAILSRNGDLLQYNLIKDAKNAETLSIANAPNPEIEGDYMIAPNGEDNRWGVGVSYGIEWPGAYGARRNMGAAMRDANAAEAESSVFAKRLEIVESLEAFLYADMRLTLMQNVLSSSDSISNIAQRSLRGGQMSRLDMSKIAIEQSRVKSIIAGIESEKLSIEGKLKTLNGGRSCTALLDMLDRDWIMSPLKTLDIYISNAKNNPEIAKTMSEFRVADKNLSVVKAESLPNFTIGYSHEFEDGMHFNGANLGVSIPLFASRHKVKAAEAAKAAAEYQITVATDKLESEVTSLYNEILSIDKALETPAYVFKTTDYTDLLFKAYNGGQLSLTEYLSELSWFYEAHLEYLELQYQRESKTNLLEMLCK